MKLRMLFCVTTPNGSAYLATDGITYYAKGVREFIPEKFDFIDGAMGYYIGSLHSVIEEHGEGCKTEVAL